MNLSPEKVEALLRKAFPRTKLSQAYYMFAQLVWEEAQPKVPSSNSLEGRLRLAEAALTKNGFTKLDDIWVAPTPTPLVYVSGEQLRQMFTSITKVESYPWELLSEAGKAMYEKVASDLVFAPDTIMANYATQPEPEWVCVDLKTGAMARNPKYKD